MTIPDNLRVAQFGDFFANGDRKKLICGMTFWIHTFHSDELEKHKTSKDTDLMRWSQWFANNRVYIEKTHLAISDKVKKKLKEFEELNYI